MINYQSTLADTVEQMQADRLIHLARQVDKRQSFLNEILSMPGADQWSIDHATSRRDRAVARLAAAKDQ